MLSQMQKWRKEMEVGCRICSTDCGIQPQPPQADGSHFPQKEGLVFNLLPPFQLSWLSPGKQTGKEAARLWLPRKASDMQLFSEFSQMMALFSEIRITQHTLHKQEGINPWDNLFTMNNSTSRSDYSKDRVKS